MSKLENDMKWSSQKTILFQVEIIKLCSEEIIEEPKHINNKEKEKIKNAVTNSNLQQKDRKQEPNISQKENLMQAISKFDSAKGWKNILDELRQSGKIMLYSNLLKAKPIEINDMTIGITFPEGLNAFGKSILEKQESISELSKIISIEYGKDMKVRIIESVDALERKEEKSELENMANSLDIPLNVID